MHYRVSGDVVVDGQIVAHAGDLADGHVEQSRAGMSPGPGPGVFDKGILRISVDSIRTFCGSTLHVASDDHADFPDAIGDVGFPSGMPFVSMVTQPQTVCAASR